MAMQIGDSEDGKVRPQMNVTPLVDVVLVLLIIFMVLAPMVTKSILARVPPKDDDETERATVPADVPVVLTVHEDGVVDVNGREVAGDALPRELHQIFNARPDNVLYVDAEDDTPYGYAVRAIASARRGGASPIVLLTHKLR